MLGKQRRKVTGKTKEKGHNCYLGHLWIFCPLSMQGRQRKKVKGATLHICGYSALFLTGKMGEKGHGEDRGERSKGLPCPLVDILLSFYAGKTGEKGHRSYLDYLWMFCSLSVLSIQGKGGRKPTLRDGGLTRLHDVLPGDDGAGIGTVRSTDSPDSMTCCRGMMGLA